MIQFDGAGPVAHITLNRPQARNALDSASLLQLEQAWTRVRDDPEIRCVVLAANGQTFCNGADMRELIPLLSGAQAPQDGEHWRQLLEAMRRGPLFTVSDQVKPVVGAVTGDAFGGGLELVLACDVTVVAATARLGFPEVRWGLAPTGLCIPRIVARAPGSALRLLLTGEPISAEAALAAGLVDEIAPVEQVADRALEIARQIAANAPLAVQGVRRIARACLGLDDPDIRASVRDLGREVFASEDAREGPAAFAQRRSANFRGR